MSEPIARSAGRPHGFRPVHLVVGVAVACAWVGLTAFVLTHGKGESSSVDVYSELPPGFTAHLRAHGVQYQGLSPVDAATTRRVLAQPLGGGVASAGSSAIVLRTALSDSRANSGPTYDNEAALMLVVPGVQTGGGPKSSVYVAFLDPLTFRSLTTLSYHAGPAVPGGASG